MITCSKCHIEQDRDQFSLTTGRKAGYKSQCKRCVRLASKAHYRKNRAVYVGKHREWRKANDGGHWAQTKTLYSMTRLDYETVLYVQDGVCAICYHPPGKRRLHIDHDHETGKIRGLLCGNCNRGVGFLQDSVASCIRAGAYLKGAV